MILGHFVVLTQAFFFWRYQDGESSTPTTPKTVINAEAFCSISCLISNWSNTKDHFGFFWVIGQKCVGRLFLHFECVQQKCIISKTGADFHKFFGGLCKCIRSNIQGGTKGKGQAWVPFGLLLDVLLLCFLFHPTLKMFFIIAVDKVLFPAE